MRRTLAVTACLLAVAGCSSSHKTASKAPSPKAVASTARGTASPAPCTAGNAMVIVFDHLHNKRTLTVPAGTRLALKIPLTGGYMSRGPTPAKGATSLVLVCVQHETGDDVQTYLAVTPGTQVLTTETATCATCPTVPYTITTTVTKA